MSPSMGVDVSVVFSDYKSVSLYLDGAYVWVHDELDFGSLGNQYSWSPGIADECAGVYNSYGLGTIHSGNWSATNVSGFELGDNGNATLSKDSGTVIFRAYRMIRICNATIDNAALVTMSDDERNKLLGQAHFLRAWGYFQLMRRYGGMPNLCELHEDLSDYDKPRLTYHGSNDLLIEDLNKAITMLPDKWDEPNIGRANKSSAYGLKSLAMTYDASPLMQNDLNSTVNNGYSKERALLAAQATKEAIDYVNSGAGPNRLSAYDANSVITEYPAIFRWGWEDITKDNSYYYQPEEGLWYNRDNSPTQATGTSIYLLPQKWANRTLSGGGNWIYSYFAPTQNMVDQFERLGSDGKYHPITSSKSGYKPNSTGAVQDMYIARDPRFYHNIIAPGMQRSCNKDMEMTPIVNDYYKYSKNNGDGKLYQGVMYDQSTNEYIVNREQTGYVLNKFCWKALGANGDENNGFTPDRTSKRIPTVFIRVSMLYLNYAEMLYEATGSYNTCPAGFTMSAAEALNIIRRRAGITDWDASDKEDNFRAAYRRERTVEFMFENHRWHDIRRWMIAEELFSAQYPIFGVYAVRNFYDESVPFAGGSEANGYTGNLIGFDRDKCDVTKVSGAMTCTPIEIKCENRVFNNRNYWYPFSTYDVNAMKNLQQNPGW